MNPFTTSLYKTLHLLVLLSRANEQKRPVLTQAEKATLRVSRQVLFDAGLTVPEFTNCLHWLSDKGYLFYTCYFDDHFRKEVNLALKQITPQEIEAKLQSQDTPKNNEKLKQQIVKNFESLMAPGTELDKEVVSEEEFKFSQAFSEGYGEYAKTRSDQLVLIIMLPFRDINRLLERVGDGEDPKTIKDDGTWYDSEKYEFHIGEDIISTSHQSKPNTEHYVLVNFETAMKTGTIWFDEIDGFRKESLRRSMYRFIEKHMKLSSIFTVHSDRVEVFIGPEQ